MYMVRVKLGPGHFFFVNFSISCLRKHAVNDFFNTNEMKVVLQSKTIEGRAQA